MGETETEEEEWFLTESGLAKLAEARGKTTEEIAAAWVGTGGRIIPDPAPEMVWAYGYNVPGYMPEADGGWTTTAADARESLASEIERYAENLFYIGGEMDLVFEAVLDAFIGAAVNIRAGSTLEHTPSSNYASRHDLGLAWWVNQVPASDVEGEEA